MIYYDGLISFDHIKTHTKPALQPLFSKCNTINLELDKLQSDKNFIKWANLIENNFYLMPTLNIQTDCATSSSTNCQTVVPHKKFYRYDISAGDRYILPVPVYVEKPIFFYLWEIFQLYDVGLSANIPIKILVTTDTPSYTLHQNKLLILPDILHCVQEHRRKLTNKSLNDLNQMVCILDNDHDLDLSYVKLMFIRYNVLKIKSEDNMPLLKSNLVICWLQNISLVWNIILNLDLNGHLIFYLETNPVCANSHAKLIYSLTHYFSKVTCYNPECSESKINFMFVICQKLLIQPDGSESIMEVPDNFTKSITQLVEFKHQIVLNAIQYIKEQPILFDAMTPKTTPYHLFKIRNEQINWAELWCKKYKMPIHPFYAMKESTPMLLFESINFAKIFPPKEGVDRSKLMMTDIGLYSITPYIEADLMVDIIEKSINKPLNNLIITESNGGLGGNTLSFAKRFGKVNTVEYSALHCDILRHNIEVYGYSNIQLYCTSYINVYEQLDQDIVFMDPPWFGPGYKYVKKLYLYIGEYLMEDIINQIKEKIKLLVIKVPFNYDIDYFKKKVTYEKLDIHSVKNYQLMVITFKLIKSHQKKLKF
jgi:hypothetical protein